MQLSEETIKEFQELFEKKSGRKISWQEASEGANNLVNFFDLLLKLHHKDQLRKEKLKEFPDGFHIEGGPYNCFVCYDHISDDKTWYDENGITCLLCHKAFKDGVIPASVITDRDSWYRMYELKDKFGIHSSTARKMVREGKLKARIILTEQGAWHYYVFIKDENKDVLKLDEVKNTVKQRKIAFEYPEDGKYFADMLTKGDMDELHATCFDVFDFRDPPIKRAEFNRKRNKLFWDLMKQYKGECQLKISLDCKKNSDLEVDHFIPLSTNVLNKQLRGMKGLGGKKVPSQSFGSNHKSNLMLACNKCNAVKKHRIFKRLANSA